MYQININNYKWQELWHVQLFIIFLWLVWQQTIREFPTFKLFKLAQGASEWWWRKEQWDEWDATIWPTLQKNKVQMHFNKITFYTCRWHLSVDKSPFYRHHHHDYYHYHHRWCCSCHRRHPHHHDHQYQTLTPKEIF